MAGWLIGKWTEYATSDEFTPTKKLAEQALTGPATLIIGGIADGMVSVWVPVLTVCLATILAFGFASGWNFNDVNYFALGLYGVGIAAVGMLSTLGITLATDAYGPIADNAGGNAEMSGLEPEVRERTDALDSLGNTTAATGKGFAIGSAALTALALLAAYVEEVRVGFRTLGRSRSRSTLADEGFYKASPGFVIEKYTRMTGRRSDGPHVPGHAVGTAPAKGRATTWSDDRRSRVSNPGKIPETVVTEALTEWRCLVGHGVLRWLPSTKRRFPTSRLTTTPR